MRVKAGIVPGFFTMANMFCGFYSAILSPQGKFMPAAWLIIAAAVLDTLDGKFARITNSSSKFGIQYDSMADVISFGLAPSLLAYFVFLQTWGTLGLFMAFTPLVFGSIRLARFNVRTRDSDKSYFEGLPIPAAAISIATFLIFNYNLWGYLRWSKIFISLTLAVSLLMVTSIRYEVMPNFSLRTDRFNRLKILAVILGAVTIILFPHEAFFPLILVYVLSGPLRVIWVIINPKYDNKLFETKGKDR